MNTPEWLKPGIYGAVAGGIVLATVGFSWGGWVTAGAADKMATERAQERVVAALVPICMAQSRQDPNATAMLTEMGDTSSYNRRDMVMDAGWATMPGSARPDRDVARACGEQLAANL